MAACGPIPEMPNFNFTEGFKDPDEGRPWWLLNVYLELPFYLPYPHRATFNLWLQDEKWSTRVADDLPEPPFVLLEVIQTTVPQPIEPSPAMALMIRNLLHERAKGDLRAAFDLIPVEPRMHIASIVEAITPKVLLQSEVEAGLENHPGTYLNRCLNAVNIWIRSLAFLTQEPSIRTIQAENLPQYMAFFHQRPNDGEIVRFDFFRAHENPVLSRNTIATRKLFEGARLMASSIDDSHGVFRSKEWFHTAVRLSTVEGRHDLGMVALNTAFEVLVFGLAAVSLADEGKSSTDIDAELGGRLGVETLCHRYFETRIGGTWDFGDPSCPIGEITSNVVEIRNRVVHQGLSVSPQQMRAGFTSFTNFAEFLVRQTAGKRWRFPRACMDLINTYRYPPDVNVGERFDRAAHAIVKATPKYWLPPTDARQATLPHVLVEATPGVFPAHISDERRMHWETTPEFFMHWVVRTASS